MSITRYPECHFEAGNLAVKVSWSNKTVGAMVPRKSQRTLRVGGGHQSHGIIHRRD